MIRYGVSFQKTAAAGAWLVQLRTAATRDARVYEVGLTLTTAAATELALVRSTTVGATFTSTTPVAEDPSASAAVTSLDTAATTAPTITGTPYIRRIQLAASIGAGIVWEFQDGFVIPVSSGLLVWGLTGTGIVDGWIAYSE